MAESNVAILEKNSFAKNWPLGLEMIIYPPKESQH
jgi:hypothetical protein